MYSIVKAEKVKIKKLAINNGYWQNGGKGEKIEKLKYIKYMNRITNKPSIDAQ